MPDAQGKQGSRKDAMQESKEQKTMRLIKELVQAESEIFKAVNTGLGRMSKRLVTEERTALSNLYEELTGQPPTENQLHDMASW